MSTTPKLRIEMLPVEALKEYEGNARQHGETDITAIKKSIEQFGFNDPIGIWGDNIIVEGHGRLMAAKDLGMTEVPVIRLDHMTDEERRAYALAHNKTAELSMWDFGKIDLELAGIHELDMTKFGFEVPTFEPDAVDDNYDFNSEVDEDRVHRGEIWALGDHRLMCGDATEANDVSALMGGCRADVCFTSPPYNMGGGKWDNTPMRNMHAGQAYVDGYTDDLNSGDYARMLCDSMQNALDHCDDVMYNIGILEGSKDGVISLLDGFRHKFLDIVVWNKSQSMPFGMKNQRGMLSHRCELIFCFNQKGSRSFTHPRWHKGNGINRIDTVSASGNKYASIHSATFPVEFAAEVLKLFTEESVLDLFGGTGTTMIASEELGRRCFMMELDPRYCAVIIDRWETFTGRKAERIS